MLSIAYVSIFVYVFSRRSSGVVYRDPARCLFRLVDPAAIRAVGFLRVEESRHVVREFLSSHFFLVFNVIHLIVTRRRTADGFIIVFIAFPRRVATSRGGSRHSFPFLVLYVTNLFISLRRSRWALASRLLRGGISMSTLACRAMASMR